MTANSSLTDWAPLDARPAPDRETLVLASAFVCALALQVFLVFNKSINWDEFFHFSQIYELQDGRLTRSIQVMHVRVFGWTSHLGTDVIGQIQAARLAMIGFELVSLFAIVSMAQLFTDRRASWLAGLTWLCGGYVFLHAFSFRGDPMATAALMSALCLVARRKLDLAIVLLVAALIGFALMSNLKSIFYAPCFAGMAWLRLSQSSEPALLVRRFAAICVLAPLSFGIMYLAHSNGLPVGEATLTKYHSGGERFFSEGFFPRGRYTLWQMTSAPVFTMALAISAWLIWRSGRPAAQRIALASLLAPLAAVAIYRNSFPYYFVFALAPAAVMAAPGIAWLRDRYGYALITAALIATPVALTLVEPRDVLPRQQAVLAEVERLFPRDARYLSYSGMAADRPRVVDILISGVGIENYFYQGRPIIAEEIEAGRLSFVIADNPYIRAALEGQIPSRTLLPRDATALHDNFVHYWGPLWLPGISIEKAGSVSVNRAGKYTVGNAPILLDGEVVAAGETIDLATGRHRVLPLAKAAILWRGERAPIPPATRIDGPLYSSF